MCPPLVDGLLAADAATAQAGQGEMLRELQLMLAFLRYADAQAYWPASFCAAFRDFDGGCLQPHEQRDADEVLSLIHI